MSEMPLQKRPNDLFISYGHVDRGRIDPIVDWLKHRVGLKVWYDAESGSASKRTTALLSDAIQASRGALFCLSAGWQSSTWCGDEHEYALTERRNNEDFLLLAVRLDDSEIPPWFKIANVLDFRKFESQACADLLRSLSANPPSRLDAGQDVYLAMPWSRQTDQARNVVRSIAAMGWRLIGDSPDHPFFTDSADRIASIIGTSRGVIAVLPHDPSKPPAFTSPWILNEALIALHSRKPYFLLAEAGVQVPNDLVEGSFGKTVTRFPDSLNKSSIQEILIQFDEELSRKPFSDTRTYSFLATSLLGDPKETDDLVSIMEHASNMNCKQGQGFTGQHVQKEIVDRITRAAFVLADVTDDHRNSLIEAGVAIGAGTPLHLMCKVPDNGSLKTRFMFEDLEMNWYRNPVERLANAYRIARLYKRRVYSPR
jgi:hypothetical protein